MPFRFAGLAGGTVNEFPFVGVPSGAGVSAESDGCSDGATLSAAAGSSGVAVDEDDDGFVSSSSVFSGGKTFRRVSGERCNVTIFDCRFGGIFLVLGGGR